jgi:RNA 2',3'-cyclic 3'-phosphodiesterase
MSGETLKEKHRTFVAIPVDLRVREALQRFQRALDNQLTTVAFQWTPPQQIHLTLTFLGNVQTSSLDRVGSALEKSCRGVRPFKLRVDGLGCFPNFRTVRIIWVGLAGGIDPLCEVQSRIAQSTSFLGEHREVRPFHPHLTIGRVKRTHLRRTNLLGQMIREIKMPELGEWTVSEIDLMKSEPAPGGSVYTCLSKISL